MIMLPSSVKINQESILASSKFIKLIKKKKEMQNMKANSMKYNMSLLNSSALKSCIEQGNSIYIFLSFLFPTLYLFAFFPTLQHLCGMYTHDTALCRVVHGEQERERKEK